LRRGSILFQIDGISSLFFIKDLNKLKIFLPGLIKINFKINEILISFKRKDTGVIIKKICAKHFTFF
jgi:hypothetical protein